LKIIPEKIELLKYDCAKRGYSRLQALIIIKKIKNLAKLYVSQEYCPIIVLI